MPLPSSNSARISSARAEKETSKVSRGKKASSKENKASKVKMANSKVNTDNSRRMVSKATRTSRVRRGSREGEQQGGVPLRQVSHSQHFVPRALKQEPP